MLMLVVMPALGRGGEMFVGREEEGRRQRGGGMEIDAMRIMIPKFQGPG